VYFAIDDTDSRQGMCTTYVGLKVILKLKELGYDIIGYPRLVRLNPNIPWKTRGNGSVVIRFGFGYGKKIKIGKYNGQDIFGKPREREKEKSKEMQIEDVLQDIERYFVLNDDNTNPGAVLTSKKLPEWLYWKGVREIISVQEIENVLDQHGAKYKKYKLGRGIIGASCGIAWRAKRKTYELLTYLPEEKFEEERWVDAESVKKMDKQIPSTFDNYDYENNYTAIMPNSRTPVLFGIRGTTPEELIKAKNIVKSTPYNAYLIYETNQGSDDHLKRRKISEIREYTSVIVHGHVTNAPKRLCGGHVIFTIADSTGEIACAAYEPTKKFRDVVSKLEIGDEVVVYGGVRKEPLTINIEKINIIKAPPTLKKISNPVCPICGRKMESIGRGKGYRCRKCGLKLPENAAEYKMLKRDIEGIYEVPVIARRHLARPLKIIKDV